MASSRFEDSNYAKKLFRLSSLFYGAMRRLSFFLIRVDNDSRGGIQLFDYRMGALIDTVDNHEGSVCSHSIAFLLLKRTGSQYHTGSTSFMDLARSLNARYVETVSTWVEGLLRNISKRVSPPNGGQNLKKTYSDLQRQGAGGTGAESWWYFAATCLETFPYKGLQLFVSVLSMFRPANFTRTYLGGAICVSCICSNGQKLKETDIAIGSGEIPVNPTPLLNETTTAAQTTMMKA
ncbi:unnamed protein product [Brassica oleracea var. botrytis]|uniref:(rape) hypothetical protein n=1 Tax=Brassica napus TaxID=3708 RepID=A0A816L904_BRANA|nr:unnamed protein product [Brassica napus]